MMYSLHSRLLWLVLGGLGLTLPMISYKSYLDARHETEELFDAQLAQTTRLLGGLVRSDMDHKSRQSLQKVLDEATLYLHAPEYPLTTTPQGHPYEGKIGFQIFTGQGQLVLRSASAPKDALIPLLEFHNQSLSSNPFANQHLWGYHNLMLDGHLWRVFLLHDQTDDLWVLAAERDDVRGELITKIAQRNLLPDLVGLPLLGLLIWLSVNCGLKPLEQMITLLKARDPSNLSPLLLEPLPRELEPMAASLNRLLLQVHHLLEREKRFLADAAHELRTPLAVLRIHQQNALAARTAQEREEALHHLGQGVERATRVLNQLLTLARLEPNASHLSLRPLNMLYFVRTELAELTPLALDRQQELVLDVNESKEQCYTMQADAPSLGIMLQNLVSNAIQYTPTGGTIQVSLRAMPHELILSVEDSGPGVPYELREKLFERFFRLGIGQGAGLGLSIVARIVELHQGRIELGESTSLGGLAIRVQLPRNPYLA